MKSKLRACFCISFASFEITTSSAPSRRASSTLFGEVVNCTTCAPNAWANLTPMWPRPPSPTIPTFCPGPTFQWRSGEYVVMPAHNSGAVAAGSRLSGTFSTYDSSTTILSEYPPYVTPPVCLSAPLYVKVGNLSQYCSSPRVQFGHVLHESTRQPTAARSPCLNFVTALPTLLTRPTISWPGTTGETEVCHSFLA